VRNTWVRLFDTNNETYMNLINNPSNVNIGTITNAWNTIFANQLSDLINGLFLTVIHNPNENARFVTCRSNTLSGQNWQTMSHFDTLTQ